ncbi:hypothetical protein BJV78DRAFT_1361192 [Lactifluus subvellereus]|nr:hypothetical protein BJV78DRAFT_1361192 [Lactifluus subvellereus]
MIIVPDWIRPWTFLNELHTWLAWIQLSAASRGTARASAAHLQHYTEPFTEPLPATSSTLQGTIRPGTFTHNTAGVPIIVVCIRADLIDDTNDLVGAGASGLGEWEERTDGILHGAGLSYTTTQPTTLNVLRQYALHVLFVPPALASDGFLDGATAPARNPFPFVHKPSTLNRDRIVIPAGWDSWGKIAVLCDGFDVKAWGEAWERDLSSDAAMPKPLYQTKAPRYAPLHIEKQTFLAKNYDENARRADRDPRGIFRSPADPSAPPAAGLVGPLGSSSFSVPMVERALAEMESGGSGATTLNVGTGLGKRGGAPSPTGQTQHEVLQNFFKSLLNTKDRAPSPGASAVSPGAAAGKAAPTGPRTSGGGGGASTSAQTDGGSGAEDG